MAKVIVPRNQQLAMAAEHPKPFYSRVVSLLLDVSQALGLKYVVTPPLGNRIWLLGVRVWCKPKAVDESQHTFFWLYSGEGVANSGEDVANWEKILPKTGLTRGNNYWVMSDGESYMEWKMMRFFEITGRRFGVIAGRSGFGDDILQVSFEISEG